MHYLATVDIYKYLKQIFAKHLLLMLVSAFVYLSISLSIGNREDVRVDKHW